MGLHEAGEPGASRFVLITLRLRPRSAAVSVLALCLGLAACSSIGLDGVSGDVDEAATSEDGSLDAPVPTPTALQIAADGGVSTADGAIEEAQEEARNESAPSQGSEDELDAQFLAIYSGVLPPDLLAPMAALPRAIELRLQEDVARCMAIEGFDYTPRLPDTEANGPPPRGQQIVQLIAEIDDTHPLVIEHLAPSSTAVDPNRAYLDGLSDAEFTRWQRTRDVCLVTSDFNVSHPLVDEANAWWRRLGEEANHRVQADPEFIAADRAAAQCLSEAGYPESHRLMSDLEEQASSVARRGDDGASLVPELVGIWDQHQTVALAAESCESARLLINSRLFGRHLAELASDGPDLELWILELRATADDYSDELAGLLPG